MIRAVVREGPTEPISLMTVYISDHQRAMLRIPGDEQPGEYLVEAVVDDGSLLVDTDCCWIDIEVKVTVK